MDRFLKLLKYIKPYRGKVVQNILFNVLGSFFALFSFIMVIPFLNILFDKQTVVTELIDFEFSIDYFQHMLNYFLSQIMGKYGDAMAIAVVSFLVIFFSLLKNGFLYLANYTLAPVRAYTTRDIRLGIYRKVLRLPLGYFSEARKGDIIARLSNDVQEIEVSIINTLMMVFRDPITIIIFLAAMIALSWQLTLSVLLILPLSGLGIGRIARSLRKKSLKGQRFLGRVMSIVEETLSGLRIIKGFNGEERMDDKFYSASNKYANLMKRVMRRRQLASPLSELLGTIVLMFLMAFGGWMVLNGEKGLESEDLIAFLIIFSQVINPVKNLSTAWFSIQKGMASVERIDELLDADERIHEVENAKELKDFNTEIEFRNVSFSYDKELVLKNLNLKIQKGKLIALVGKSGAGKSTLVDLLPRFMDPDEGEILLDGIPINEYRIKDLRKLMGIVSQQSILFNDTFTNNIAFGTEESSEEVITEAARVANALEFILENEEGFDAGVGDGGNKLSGGQKQRISIARAVMANPPIMILDEATSSLDTESEKLVQDALEKLMENRTSIVIAHRLSTIKNADCIIVLDEGRIVEQGTHDELVNKKGGVYRKLHKLQTF